MKTSLVVGLGLTTVSALLVLAATENRPAGDGPQFTSDGQLIRPKNYRKWVYLSSGLGMVYGPAAEGARADSPRFDNVFVNPASYDSFLETGKWPDHTMFVLEVRNSESKKSINQGGRFQWGLAAVEAEVKDEKRFPGKWAFFGFGDSAPAARQIPASDSCYSCHATNGAVDNTFVQFYPTLFEVARAKGTLKVTATPVTGEDAKTVDPVCNMGVNPAQALKAKYKGKTYHFCSQDCKKNFETAPATYAKN